MVTANLQMAVSSVDCRSLCWLAMYYMQLGILLNGEAGHRGQAVRTQVSAHGRVSYSMLLSPWSTLNCQVAEAES